MRYDMLNDPRFDDIPREAIQLFLFVGWKSGKNGWIKHSSLTIAKELRTTKRTVNRWFEQLSSAGLIRRWQEGGYTYTAIDESLAYKGGTPEVMGDTGVSPTNTGGTPTSHHRDTHVPAVGHPRPTGGTPMSPKVQVKNKKKNKVNIYTPEFEEWYAHYPRKVNKPAAAKAYLSAAEKADQATLIAGIQTIDASEPKYIPHPATWLNGERWNDTVVQETSIYDDIEEALRRSQLQSESGGNNRVAQGHLALVGHTPTPEDEGRTAGQDDGTGRNVEQIPSRTQARSFQVPVKRMPGLAGRQS